LEKLNAKPMPNRKSKTYLIDQTRLDYFSKSLTGCLSFHVLIVELTERTEIRLLA